LFHTAVESTDVLHCVGNTSDHNPAILKLSIDIERVACSVKVHASKIDRYKADICHIANYKEILDGNLFDIRLPVDALLCQDIFVVMLIIIRFWTVTLKLLLIHV
jgi:hypothetical protein